MSTTRMFTKTLFIALALFMVVGAIAATEEIQIEERGISCTCRGRAGTYWFWSFNQSCCRSFMGKCCPN
ncbi:U-actitoxin-Bgr3b-like [Tubulanus polymorphus]|uniref:U-actitoxin-Bgr3b-like n=1 Tax=Tubulanus polymorphus TaxID=672921 RepID=UPI003DA2CCB7